MFQFTTHTQTLTVHKRLCRCEMFRWIICCPECRLKDSLTLSLPDPSDRNGSTVTAWGWRVFNLAPPGAKLNTHHPRAVIVQPTPTAGTGSQRGNNKENICIIWWQPFTYFGFHTSYNTRQILTKHYTVCTGNVPLWGGRKGNVDGYVWKLNTFFICKTMKTEMLFLCVSIYTLAHMCCCASWVRFNCAQVVHLELSAYKHMTIVHVRTYS